MASNDVIERLYDGLAEELVRRLETPACPHCGTHGLSASEMGVMRQFLSDNEMRRITRPRGGEVPSIRKLPVFPEDGEEPVQRTA